jgi:S-formylglutathione hydrolase FrmB
MAVFQINFFSGALRRQVNMAAVVPVDLPPEMKAPETFKPMYLLHGFTGSYLDWLTGFPLPRLAEKYGCAMFMPSGENGFYLNDGVLGYRYEDFICEELPAFCRRLFPISAKREDTTIAGISMGGFGALHSALAKPDMFGNVIAVSPALITGDVSRMKEGEMDSAQIAPYEYYRHVFGPPASLLGSHADPKALAKQLSVTPDKLPRLYIACGSEDFLIGPNRDFHAYLESLNIAHEYVEAPGIHDWNFFSAYFSKGLDWVNGGGGAHLCTALPDTGRPPGYLLPAFGEALPLDQR